jgi:hypothetical protein
MEAHEVATVGGLRQTPPQVRGGGLTISAGHWQFAQTTGVDMPGGLRIDVDKSSYHQLSQSEIDGDSPCYQHLSVKELRGR